MTQPSKSAHLLGQKIGMTRVYTEDGTSLPVTVIKVEPNTVTQIRTPEVDGYSAVQVGAGEIKARNSTMPMIGHDAKAGVAPRRKHAEFRVEEGAESNWELGQTLSVSEFDTVKFVDVIGISKGKGFQGGMKRWGFKGQLASHGVERKHRSPGSIGGHGNNAGKSGRIKKGKKMSGHMGNTQITMRSLDVVRVDADQNLLLVKGPVPGHNNAWVEIRPATRLYRSKASKA
ncbi:MAG: 50S ribosomal protein L3 [Phycisphaerae bacterium]|nr:50S ribosomal protein L3 [Phycisphaerae bacterium]MBM92785.1 50S ribosomal protein L3 [Phycisphaerae bacterium]HCT43758.1 50S ribosomal protein L3 [Phycisphaerales bacterium]|tara:strand:- start:422 stop:1111 length:690 start_codon:yes stop_codon:yes gene_type:complete